MEFVFTQAQDNFGETLFHRAVCSLTEVRIECDVLQESFHAVFCLLKGCTAKGWQYECSRTHCHHDPRRLGFRQLQERPFRVPLTP